MKSGLVPALLLAVLGGVLVILAGYQSGFPAPDLKGYTQTHEEDGDGDGDGVNETHIRHYSNAAGDKVFSMTTRGSIWAWSLQGEAAADGAQTNYVILDTDCDGRFDKRLSLDEEFHVPECLSSPE
jgi:hypothetical protein